MGRMVTSIPGGQGLKWDLRGDVGCTPSPNSAVYGADIIASKRRWSVLSERTRKPNITTAVAEGILKTAALIDIRCRRVSQIRVRSRCGPRDSSSQHRRVVPISYFLSDGGGLCPKPTDIYP